MKAILTRSSSTSIAIFPSVFSVVWSMEKYGDGPGIFYSMPIIWRVVCVTHISFVGFIVPGFQVFLTVKCGSVWCSYGYGVLLGKWCTYEARCRSCSELPIWYTFSISCCSCDLWCVIPIFRLEGGYVWSIALCWVFHNFLSIMRSVYY